MVTPVRHILSFDVESWFDGNLYRKWTYQPDQRDPRLLNEIPALLDLLEQHEVQATFFVLGALATDYPDLVRRIAAAGHEIACHAWTHDLVRELGPLRYLAHLRRARRLLQDLSGQAVLGQRAPSWSIDNRVPWAADALVGAGFNYDSSIFPMRTPLYGEPRLPTSPYWLEAPSGGRLLELPPAVRRFGPLRVPFGGGLYWRLLPHAVVRALLRRADSPVVAYLHPWELNPEPLTLPPGLPFMQRMALRYGVRGARYRLQSILDNFSFGPFQAAIPRLLQEGPLPTLSLGGD